MNVAVVPARGGSVRIPRKNIREFFGRPIIAYSIGAARDSGLFDLIVVSTDDDEISEVSQKHGATVMRRSKEEADDEKIGTQEVAAEVLKFIRCDYACCIYATAPMLKAKDLQWTLSAVRKGHYDYVYSPGWFYWGKRDTFIEKPNYFLKSLSVVIDPRRYIDINTPADWSRAERMFEICNWSRSQQIHA